MVQRFVLMHERSIKELTRAADFPSSWQFLKTNRFGDANRRGSPSRIEGLGSWMKGVWGRFPQWVWATPKVWGEFVGGVPPQGLMGRLRHIKQYLGTKYEACSSD
ncbi:hypothetical protein BK744_09165 [Bacillus thuringiensis serovar zhaodongensis]|nr:hypothetical protein BK744_09165 [Bacillus thuringiensis serovar zhaodongensis]